MNNKPNNMYPKTANFKKVPSYTESENITESSSNYNYELPYIPLEKFYMENILMLNKGKKVKAYVSFVNSTEWKDHIFSGIIENSGKDFLIISDPSNGNWYLIQLCYLDYIEFEEKIN